MPLHNKDSVRDLLEDEVYASSDLSVSMPKYKFPESEQDPRHVYTVVHDELMLDGNSRQNLATFCQTWVEPEVHKLMNECIDKNMIDKDEYPQTAEIEGRCVHMMATSGTRRRRQTPSAVRPPAPAKQPCWVEWQ
jgi:glutamate decarboxylase